MKHRRLKLIYLLKNIFIDGLSINDLEVQIHYEEIENSESNKFVSMQPIEKIAKISFTKLPKISFRQPVNYDFQFVFSLSILYSLVQLN